MAVGPFPPADGFGHRGRRRLDRLPRQPLPQLPLALAFHEVRGAGLPTIPGWRGEQPPGGDGLLHRARSESGGAPAQRARDRANERFAAGRRVVVPPARRARLFDGARQAPPVARVDAHAERPAVDRFPRLEER